MKDFAGRSAVVTGGGSGMGRELVRQLSRGSAMSRCATSLRRRKRPYRLSAATHEGQCDIGRPTGASRSTPSVPRASHLPCATLTGPQPEPDTHSRSSPFAAPNGRTP
jgi:NAD(P)-dependent dehydrogenase (short-subunit alcohol dehydrogenase family)